MLAAAATATTVVAIPVDAATATTRVTPAESLGALHRLSSDLLPGLSRLTPTGHPAVDRELTITVMLNNPNNAALQRLAAAVDNPKSAEYHRYRSPAQLDAEFGLPASTGTALRHWLTAGGLSITYSAGSNDVVQASGSVAEVEKLFGTSIASYRVNGTSFLANTRAPLVPSGLSIASLMGLNTLQRFAPPKAVVAKNTVPSGTGCLEGLTTPCEEGYDAKDMWSLYDATPKNLGQGETMAVFGEGQTAPVIGDLRRYEHYNHLRRVPVKVIHVGKGPFVSNDGQGEWDLDTQSSTSISPDVKQLDLYFAKTLTDADVSVEFSKWLSDPNGPMQANASFGECETDPLNPVIFPIGSVPSPISTGLGDNLEPAIENSVMPRIEAEGRTLFNSSGDTGSSCPVVVLSGVGAGNGLLNQAVPLQEYPTVSKYVTSVGGTLLYSNGGTPAKRTTEIASPYGGGGSSIFNSEPAWQKSNSKVIVPCAVDYTGKPYAPGTTCRGVPDVSALFGDSVGLGFNIFYNGRLLTTGGTSLASPLWMGVWTRVQAASKDPSKGNGFASPTLYKVAQSSKYQSAFTDITVGTNGAYQAGSGWDYVTGWGSPKIAGLIKAVDGKLTPTRPKVTAAAKLPTFSRCPVDFTSPAHNAIDGTLLNYPGNIDVQNQLDITKGAVSETKDKQYLKTVMTISNLQKTVPVDASQPSTALAGGEDWIFQVVIKGITYYADAHYENGADVTYSGGKVDPKTGTAQPNTAEKVVGQFHTGKHGRIVMDIPLSAITGAKKGVRVGFPYAFTPINSAVPFLAFADAAGPQKDYKLGSKLHKKC